MIFFLYKARKYKILSLVLYMKMCLELNTQWTNTIFKPEYWYVSLNSWIFQVRHYFKKYIFFYLYLYSFGIKMVKCNLYYAIFSTARILLKIILKINLKIILKIIIRLNQKCTRNIFRYIFIFLHSECNIFYVKLIHVKPLWQKNLIFCPYSSNKDLRTQC